LLPPLPPLLPLLAQSCLNEPSPLPLPLLTGDCLSPLLKLCGASACGAVEVVLSLT
jgi:hypothetical protein